MYRIETHSTTHESTLGPCIEIEDPKHALAFADGLRAEGLDVELLYREKPSESWRKLMLEELLPSGMEAPPQPDRIFDEFVVIVRSDNGGEDYELATPTLFLTRSLAEDYAAATLPIREARIVRGRFSQLKF